MKNAVSWSVTPCGSCEERRFGRNYRPLRLLATANVDPSSPILAILMREAIRSSETSLFRRASRRNIPEEGILRESFCKTGCSLFHSFPTVTPISLTLSSFLASGTTPSALEREVFTLSRWLTPGYVRTVVDRPTSGLKLYYNWTPPYSRPYSAIQVQNLGT
jgi:hypothetical protein